MQATSPLRKKQTIIDALQKFSVSEDLELMMAVTETSNSPLKYGFLNNLLEEIQIRKNNVENFIYISLLAVIKIINKLLSIIKNFDGNKFLKYKYKELHINKINNLNKFYEYIQKKKKFKRI